MAHQFTKMTRAYNDGGRELGLDLVRVSAMLMVVMLHVAGEGFSSLGPEWFYVNLYDSLCRASVPIFFILSGCLILPKETRIRDVLRRVMKLVIPLFIWSLVFILLMRNTDLGRMQSPGTELNFAQIFKGPVLIHLWFLYTLIGLYLFSPMQSIFYRSGPWCLQVFYLAMVFFGSSMLPFVRTVSGEQWGGIDFSFFPIYAGYMFLGAMLSRWIPSKRTSLLLVGLGVGAGLGIALLTALTAERIGRPTEIFYAYWSPFAVCAATCFFGGLRGVGPSLRDSVLEAPIVALAPLTFGIYILHFPVLVYLMDAGFTFDVGGAAIGIPFSAVVIFLATAGIVAVIRITLLGRILCPA